MAQELTRQPTPVPAADEGQWMSQRSAGIRNLLALLGIDACGAVRPSHGTGRKSMPALEGSAGGRFLSGELTPESYTPTVDIHLLVWS